MIARQPQMLQMSAVETGQMSSVEKGQMLAVETGQMSSSKTGRCPVSLFYISLVPAEDICLVSTADIYPVSTEDVCPVSTADIWRSGPESAKMVGNGSRMLARPEYRALRIQPCLERVSEQSRGQAGPPEASSGRN